VTLACEPDLNILALEVYDSVGRMQMRVLNSTSADISSLNEGVYAVKIITQKGILSRSLFVTKK
jgi:hypothetical protein